jgi:hypothetical protein
MPLEVVLVLFLFQAILKKNSKSKKIRYNGIVGKKTLVFIHLINLAKWISIVLFIKRRRDGGI